MSDLSGGGLGTTLRISIWQNIFCCNVPVFIHVHGADGMGETMKQVSDSGAQDNRRNLAVNVHVMTRLLLCVFSHAAACQTCRGWARHYFANLNLAEFFSVAMYQSLYMYMELTGRARL